ncbi:MAG TPA: diguanylate cyclase [Gemmatimonadales bacterium]|nr:diguanylate cyclase [Gemmatimonadales bacterium]
MRSWEAIISKYLQALRLERISSKLVAFAVLATLIPSLSTAWVSYVQNKRSLEEKINGQLQTVSSETQREIDLWLKERLYDLRVFASSYEVTENLARASTAERRSPRRLTDYLSSVRERFADYEALLVVDREGHVVASNPAKATALTLPHSWYTDVSAGNPTVGDVYWDQAAGRAIEVVAVPIRQSGGRLLGALAAKLNLGGVDHILKRFAPVPSGALYVITNDGRVVTSSLTGSTKPMRTALPTGTTRALMRDEGENVEYRGLDQSRVVGTLRRVPRLNWSVVGEVPVVEAYRQVIRLRNETAMIVTALLIGVGLLAYFLGLLIVRPLNRLTQGAALVASGNLDVDLPVTSGGEVGYLTEVFNNMVNRLREGRAELERLSVTDPLTKLHNRRYLMEALTIELGRCRRHRNPATVLMVDVDNFKKYNDAFGHLAGDEALARVAAALQGSIREVDCAARYGGEEFIVVLSETGLDGAQAVTDRIRTRLATEVFQGGKITVSIGVAEFPTHGETPEALIRSADTAMYDAKEKGRNRVARAAVAAPKKRA